VAIQVSGTTPLTGSDAGLGAIAELLPLAFQVGQHTVRHRDRRSVTR
jgi:hypothetical protein